MEDQVKSKLQNDASAANELSIDDSSTAESDSDSDVTEKSSASIPQSRQQRNVDENGLVYLTRLPRHERRRIKLDVRKKRKVALTVNNVFKVLERVELKTLYDILHIPASIDNESSTDEDKKISAIKWWIANDPLASWRRLTNQLYRSSSTDDNATGDKIRHYCEDVTDTSLTLENLDKVLTTVSTILLTECFTMPHTMSGMIRDYCSDEKQQRQQLMKYFIHVSMYSAWALLASPLHYYKYTTAEAATMAYVKTASATSKIIQHYHNTIEPTLTVQNLTNVMKSVRDVTQWFDIPHSKLREIKMNHPNVTDFRQELFRYYINHRPGASWLQMADTAWVFNEDAVLDMINRSYLKGTSESRRILQASMKHGTVDAFIDKMLFHGCAGVGKTCTQHIVAGDNPPDVRNSTPLATRPVTIYQLQAMNEVWKKYESQDRMKLCAQISKSVLGKDIIKVLQSKKSKDKTPRQRRRKPPKSEESSMPVENADIKSTPQPKGKQATKAQETYPPSEKSVVDPEVVKVIHDTLDKMYQLIDECPDDVDPITYLHKVRIVDCGGQHQFHEILPIFLQKMSMIVFVIKLSEELSSRPTVEYYEEGKALGESYESHYTTEQLLQQDLQSIHSHRSNKDSEGESPRIVVVGTHKDLEKCCKETREMKNQKLREMLLPTFSKEIVYSQASTNDVIFPMNAKHPGKEEEDVAAAIRSVISCKRQSNPRQLPLMWLTLEIILEEITKALNRGVLTMDECFEIARRLHFDESTLEAALIYFDELSLIFYYRDILPGLVFTNPQLVLAMISELVKIHHGKIENDPSESEAWQEFYHHALVTIKFLSQKMFEKHYVAGIFEPEHIKLLYRKLFIFADYSKEKFFVPSLLRMLDNEEVSKKRVALDSAVAPLVLHFPDGPPRRGIFCALMSFLTSPENHYPGPWKVKMPARSLSPTCLYRNCIQFTIPNAKCPCTITLIDTLLQFEVHLKIVSKESPSKICCSIKQAITTGLQKANVILGYTNSTPSFALLCPCGEGGPHHASFGDGYWICSLDEGVGDELSPNQHIWLEDNSVTATQDPSGAAAIDHPALKRKPLLHLLDSIYGYRKIIKVIRRSAAYWERVATRLYFEGQEIKCIKIDHHLTEDCCRNMFVEWLDGTGRTPKTWETVIKALDEADLGEIATELKIALSVDEGVDDELSPNQHIWLEDNSTTTATKAPSDTPSLAAVTEKPPPYEPDRVKGSGKTFKESDLQRRPVEDQMSKRSPSQSSNDSCSGAAAIDYPALKRKPLLHQLDSIYGNGKIVKVIRHSAAYWERVATRLHFEGQEIKSIKIDHHSTEDCCRNMFVEWLDGTGRKPKTWETVIKALDEADLGEIATELKTALSVDEGVGDELSPNQHIWLEDNSTTTATKAPSDTPSLAAVTEKPPPYEPDRVKGSGKTFKESDLQRRPVEDQMSKRSPSQSSNDSCSEPLNSHYKFTLPDLRTDKGYEYAARSPLALVQLPNTLSENISIQSVNDLSICPSLNSNEILITPIFHFCPQDASFHLSEPAIVELMKSIVPTDQNPNRHLVPIYSSGSDPLQWKEVFSHECEMLEDRVRFKTTEFGYVCVKVHFPFPSASITVDPTLQREEKIEIKAFPGFKMEIPPVSVDSSTTITTTVLYHDPQVTKHFNDHSLASACIKLEPHNTQFQNKVKITLPIPNYSKITQKYPDAKLQVWHAASTDEGVPMEWEPQSFTIDYDEQGNCLATAYITHFSLITAIWSGCKTLLTVTGFLNFFVSSVRGRCQVFMTHERKLGSVLTFGVAVLFPWSHSEVPNHPHCLFDSVNPIEITAGDVECQIDVDDVILQTFSSANKQKSYTETAPISDSMRADFVINLYQGTGRSDCELPAGPLATLLIKHGSEGGKPYKYNLVKPSPTSTSSAISTPPDSTQVASHPIMVEEDCQLLTESDLASVQRAVWEGRAKWYNLGLELGIPLGTLDAIQQTNHHVADDCFRATLVEWLGSSELRPSWSSLARSLRAAPVGLGELADQLNSM